MNLNPNDEETQLQETMRRFVAGQDAAHGTDMAARYDAAWRAFAELGGAGMAIGEREGGFGVSPEGMALAAFELGEMPFALPRIEQVVAVARLLEAAEGNTADALRSRFVAGEAHVVLADWEGGGQHGFNSPAARLGRGTETNRLFARKAAVIGAQHADVALVTIRIDQASALVAVRLDGVHCRVTPHRLTDLTPVADLDFDDARIEGDVLLRGQAFEETWDRARDEAIVIAAAASCGSMIAAIRLTVDYLKIRQQFGSPLSTFQALQQRVADLYIEANDARSSVYAALAALHLPAAQRRRAISGCKLKVARAARHVTGEAIHLHGGIGFTAEYTVGHHHRRAQVDEKLFGDSDFHLQRYLAADAAIGMVEEATPLPRIASLARSAAKR